MKGYACVVTALMLLAPGFVQAEQSASTTRFSTRAMMPPPSSGHQPGCDINHSGTKSDKSDTLGVPWYNQR